MAGLTHTIGGVSFAALASTTGLYSLGCFPASDEYEILRFHPPGGTGNYVVRNGLVAGSITARMRYVGASATILSQFAAHKAAWENTAVTVVDSAGTSALNCNLKPGTLRIIDGPHGIGGSAVAYMDVEAEFTRD